MPNWCNNTLIISGELDDLDKFYTENRNYNIENNEENEELDFYKSVPIPENIYMGNLGSEERRLYGRNNWFDWNMANLGVKWNVHDSYYEKDETKKEIKYEFETPWSPPITWLIKTSIKYPNLIFLMKYCEYGMGFGGEIMLHGEHEIKNETWDLIDKEREKYEYYNENKEEIDNLIIRYYNSKMTNYIELNENEKFNLINDILGDLFEEGHSINYEEVEDFIIDCKEIN